MSKSGSIKSPDVYKCTFNGYSPVVQSVYIKAYSIFEAIEQCKIIFGESTVKRCLMSVELTCPF